MYQPLKCPYSYFLKVLEFHLRCFFLVNFIKHIKKRLCPSKVVKYLVVKIDGNLNWKDQTHDIATKLNRGNGLLYKIRNYVSFNTLKAIYFAILDSHINYANLIWGQNPNSKLRIITLQKKTLRIINNSRSGKPRNNYSGPLFKKSNILKF